MLKENTQRFALLAGGAGVDNAWEQRKLEASLPWRAVQGKMLAVGAAESHLPKRSEGVHVVLGVFDLKTLCY